MLFIFFQIKSFHATQYIYAAAHFFINSHTHSNNKFHILHCKRFFNFNDMEINFHFSSHIKHKCIILECKENMAQKKKDRKMDKKSERKDRFNKYPMLSECVCVCTRLG